MHGKPKPVHSGAPEALWTRRAALPGERPRIAGRTPWAPSAAWRIPEAPGQWGFSWAVVPSTSNHEFDLDEVELSGRGMRCSVPNQLPA